MLGNTVVLVFSNADAKPHNVKIECTLESVPPIMEWYGGHFSGDLYTVTVDGRNIPLDTWGQAVNKIKKGL